MPQGLVFVPHGKEAVKSCERAARVGQNDETNVRHVRTFVEIDGGKFTEPVCDGETKPTEKREKYDLLCGKRHDFSEQITIVIEREFR